MIDPADYDDIIVTVGHPWGDAHPTLTEWVREGPGPWRPFVKITDARRKSTGELVSLDEIPQEYHNTRKSRRLQRAGELPMPWGPPPDELPLPEFPASMSPELRKEYEDG